MFLTKANVLFVRHFTVRIASHGEFVELQDPFEGVLVVAKNRVEFGERKDDEPLALQSGPDLFDQVFLRKRTRIHSRGVQVTIGSVCRMPPVR